MGDQSVQRRNDSSSKNLPSDKIKDAIDLIEDDILDLKQKQDALQKQISEKETGKEEYMARRKEMQQKLDEYQKYIDDYEKQRQAIWAEIDNTNQDAKNRRDKLNTEKNKIPYRTVQAIDEEISRIEHAMWSQSLSGNDEKKMVKKICELKAHKPQLAKVQALQENQGTDKDATGDLQKRLQYLNQNLKDARDAKKAQMDQLRKLTEQRDGVRADMGAIFDQRSKLRDEIKRKINAKRELIEEKRAKERAERAFAAEMKAAKNERQRADRLKNEAAFMTEKIKRQEDYEEDPPHLLETTRLEQIIKYCKNLVGEEEVAAEVGKTDVKHDNPKGSTVLAKKKDRDADDWFVGTGKKTKKEKSKTKKNDKIKHTVDSLKMFAQFKIQPPLTTSDVAPIIEELQTQLDGFKGKVTEWENQREMRRAEAERKNAEQRALVEELQKKAEAAQLSAKEMDAKVRQEHVATKEEE